MLSKVRILAIKMLIIRMGECPIALDCSNINFPQKPLNGGIPTNASAWIKNNTPNNGDLFHNPPIFVIIRVPVFFIMMPAIKNSEAITITWWIIYKNPAVKLSGVYNPIAAIIKPIWLMRLKHKIRKISLEIMAPNMGITIVGIDININNS